MAKKRNVNTITPEKKTKEQVKRQKNVNDNIEVESLTDDDAETIETLTSKMDGLESGQKRIEQKFKMILGLLSKGGGVGNSQVIHHGPENPDPKGEGSGL